MSALRPRRCVLHRAAGGYGFHLHGERGRSGQFIRLVEPDTPAAAAGLLAGDRLVFVNGERVEGDSHQQVVARIRAAAGALELIVVDEETSELLRRHGLQCREEFVTEGLPLPGTPGGEPEPEPRRDSRSSGGSPTPDPARTPDPAPVPVPVPVREENGEPSPERARRLSRSSDTEDERDGPRPRLCHLKKGDTGYGFNLHSEKSRPGQFIKAVDEDSPAQRAGLRPKDKIVQVNGVSVVGMQHSEVVAIIKAGGDATRLLVVDPETDEFFKRCNVLPTEEHITGPLPEPVSERVSEDEETSGKVKPQLSARSSASSSSSNASLPAANTSSPRPQVESGPGAAGDLGLGMSVAQARERAQQKRAAKKAPAMDWSKKAELFSSL